MTNWRQLLRQLASLAKVRQGSIPRVAFGMAAAAVVTSEMLFTGVPAASAATNSADWHETYGHYAIGAPSLALYAPVRETPDGRYMHFVNVKGGYEVELALDADPSKCVAASDSGYWVVLHACNGGLGTVWVLHVGSAVSFESREFPGRYLAGDNHGDEFELKSPSARGWYEQFYNTL
jgi:hypothetical protein